MALVEVASHPVWLYPALDPEAGTFGTRNLERLKLQPALAGELAQNAPFENWPNSDCDCS